MRTEMGKSLLILWAGIFACNIALAAGLDLNTASEAQLEAIKGIGPVKARAIVEHRARHGPFKTLDELDAVPGFGAKTIDGIRTQLRVEDSAGDEGTLPAKAAAEPRAVSRVKCETGNGHVTCRSDP
ncbi:MAG: ComEA family DNA-binding protein [Burkholderiales bacterium]